MDEFNSNQILTPPPAKKRSFSTFFAGLAGVLVGGALVWSALMLWPTTQENPAKSTSAVTEQTTLYDESIVTKVAREVGPAVVGISTTQISYDNFLQQYPRQGVGSGFILNQEGYIMTNAHVVAGATNIFVTLSDGRKLQGTIVGLNRAEDIAVVKINAKDLPAVALGDSDAVMVGQMAIAIGNPLGLELQRTVTVGIISAIARSLTDGDGNIHEDMLQTDASINFGNSGGPLVNSRGEVIGINTAKIPGAEGLGFAIPINIARPIAEEIIAGGGQNNRAWLGIAGADVTDDVAAYYGLPVRQGVLILQVVETGPAASIGIQPGDIITQLDGKEINSMRDLQKVLRSLKPGSQSDLTIISGNNQRQAKITLGQAPQ